MLLVPCAKRRAVVAARGIVDDVGTEEDTVAVTAAESNGPALATMLWPAMRTVVTTSKLGPVLVRRDSNSDADLGDLPQELICPITMNVMTGVTES